MSFVETVLNEQSLECIGCNQAYCASNRINIIKTLLMILTSKQAYAQFNFNFKQLKCNSTITCKSNIWRRTSVFVTVRYIESQLP
jgi:hypothetical protein